MYLYVRQIKHYCIALLKGDSAAEMNLYFRGY